ncbi:hypothetical protein DJ60_3932 [Yersinia enterocolitica]|nr:hypothetical protein DJ60_3932 [Yersinia enterocolitica]CQQ88343.1 Uncharacterised protein [Yersinia enterocolitica]
MKFNIATRFRCFYPSGYTLLSHPQIRTFIRAK